MKDTAIRLQKIIFILFTILLIPLAFTHSTIEPVLPLRFVLLAALLLGIITFISFRFSLNKASFDYTILRRAIFPVFLIYLFFAAISLAQGINFAEGLFDLLKISLYFIFLFVSTLLFTRDETLLADLSRAFAVLAAALSFIGICQYFGIAFSKLPGNYIVYATMANKNLLSEALLLTFPFLLFGILNFKGAWALLSMVAMMLAGFVIGVAHTRAAWAALTGATVITSVIVLIFSKQLSFPAKWKTRLLRRLSYAAILCILALLLSALAHFTRTLQSESMSKALAGANLPVSSIDERLRLWEKTLQMIADHPIGGVGLGNWKIMLPRYGAAGLRSESGEIHFVRPHNDFLWVFAETGALGFLSYLLIFGLVFYYAYRLIAQAQQPAIKIIALLMVFGISGYVLISLAAFPRERIVQSSFLWLMVAVLVSFYHASYPLKKPISTPAGLAVNLLFIAALLAALAVGYSRLVSEIHIKKSLDARKAGRFELEISELNQAETSFYNLDPAVTPVAFIRGTAQVRMNRLEPALQDFQQALKVHPYNMVVLSNLGTAFQKTGRPEKALEMFHKVLEISPRHEHTLLNLAAVYFEMGKFSEAYQAIRRCDPHTRNPRVAEYRKKIEARLNLNP